MYAPVLAGAGGSPPLCRCDLRAWCSKTMFYRVLWAWKIQNLDLQNAKTVGFTRVVSVMRAARTCVIGFFGDGPVSTPMAQNVPQDDPTEAPKIGPRCVNIAARWANIGPRWPKMAQHRPKRGPT